VVARNKKLGFFLFLVTACASKQKLNMADYEARRLIFSEFKSRAAWTLDLACRQKKDKGNQRQDGRAQNPTDAQRNLASVR
jgi:hypothetical protein